MSADLSPSEPPSVAKRGGARLAGILGGSAGNFIEWYDWFAYASFSLYFAHAFFPHGSELDQRLQAAAVFAVGFLARPAGAWLMGVFADRHGRKAALIGSVAAMCGGSAMIAVTPGAKFIGVAAQALLIVAALSGASASAASMARAPPTSPRWRGLAGGDSGPHFSSSP